MDETEKEAMEAYQQEGVELPPEAEPTEPEEEPVEEPKEEEPVKEPEEEEPKEEEEALENEPPVVPKKRSIYQDLKETRKDAKSEKERADEAEQRANELQAKLDAAETPAEKKEVASDLDAFAKEIGADPAALEQMRELFLKDLPKNEVPEELSSQLQEFQEWQKGNSEAMEKVQFEAEFEAAQPSLTAMFPDADAEAMKSIKAEVDKLAHTDAFHDKEVDYILFKNQDALKALVSPKKRGLETKKKGDAPAGDSFNFDPNADLSKLSPEAAEKWEKEYNKATSSEGLQVNDLGQKIII